MTSSSSPDTNLASLVSSAMKRLRVLVIVTGAGVKADIEVKVLKTNRAVFMFYARKICFWIGRVVSSERNGTCVSTTTTSFMKNQLYHQPSSPVATSNICRVLSDHLYQVLIVYDSKENTSSVHTRVFGTFLFHYRKLLGWDIPAGSIDSDCRAL